MTNQAPDINTEGPGHIMTPGEGQKEAGIQPPPEESSRLARWGANLIDKVGTSPGEATDAGIVRPGENYEATRVAQGVPTHTGEEGLSDSANERAQLLDVELDRIEGQAVPGYHSRPEGSSKIPKTETPPALAASPIDMQHLQRNLNPNVSSISGSQVNNINPAVPVNPPLQTGPRKH